MRLITLVALVMAIPVATASAQTPPTNAYGGAGGVLGGVVTTPSPSPAPAPQPAGTPTGSQPGTGESAGEAPDGGVAGDTDVSRENVAGVAGETVSQPEAVAGTSLPFTGFDLLLMVAGGTVLVFIGIVLRRLGRRDDDLISP